MRVSEIQSSVGLWRARAAKLCTVIFIQKAARFRLGRVLSTVTNATLKILWPDLNGFDIAPVKSTGMDVKETAADTTLPYPLYDGSVAYFSYESPTVASL